MLEVWRLLAGITVFLLGTWMMEESVRQMAGRRFKLFLKSSTRNPFKAIAGGTIVTAVLQSSSVVNFLILSLVGSGVMQMRQALAVMLGSNLGTTFTNWIIAGLGFRINPELYAWPVMGVAGMLLFYSASGGRLRKWSGLFFGFSLLFIGLDFMNQAMREVVLRLDLSLLTVYPLPVFFLAGIFITALVQASSVTVVLSMSALNAGIISLPMAAALVLGAEIGTTIKFGLASVKGVAAKKRVALGNSLFNIITSIFLLPFIRPILQWMNALLPIDDQLYLLVCFQTLVNVVGIVLFFPFLNMFGRYLEKRFKEESELEFLQKIKSSDAELAIEAMEREVKHFIERYHLLTIRMFDLPVPASSVAMDHNHKSTAEIYKLLKKYYGEMHAFSIRWKFNDQQIRESERKDQLLSSVRNAMYAAKSIKDSRHDIGQLSNSSNDIKYGFYIKLRTLADSFIRDADRLLYAGNVQSDQVLQLYESVMEYYQKELQTLNDLAVASAVNALEISTLLNVHREVVTSFKSAVIALKDFLLSPEQAVLLDVRPGFIR
jgi:phosphate:Na+ symporter